MQFAGRRSWQVRIDGDPLLPHAALYVREACGIPVNAGGVPPLLVTPPPTEITIDSGQWLAWWRTLVAAGAPTWLSGESGWPFASPVLVAALEPLGDEPLRWVSSQVDDETFGWDAQGLPIEAAVRQLEREFGRRSIMDVRIAGLAVAGDWVEVQGDGSTVLASWSAFDRAGDWLVETLREPFRRSLR